MRMKFIFIVNFLTLSTSLGSEVFTEIIYIAIELEMNMDYRVYLNYFNGANSLKVKANK